MSALPVPPDLAERWAADLAARQAVADLKARAADLRRKAERLNSEADHADAVQMAEASAVIADGGPVPDLADSPGAALRREAEATRRAAERVAADLPAREAAAARARAALVHAALTAERALRAEGMAALQAAIFGLAPALGLLIASTSIRRNLIGDRFTFDPGDHPPSELWSGEHRAAAVMTALGASNVCPSGFAEAARAESARIVNAVIDGADNA